MIETLSLERDALSTCERLEIEVFFSEVTYDIPAELTFYTLQTLPNGQHLPCAQTVQVLEAGLLQRLSSLNSGDKIKVSLETDWASEDILTVLKNYVLV